MIAGVVLIAILLFFYFFGRKSVHTELVIEASPEQIWEVLMDEEAYKEWNQVLIPITGRIEQGNKLTYALIQPEGKSIEIGMKVIELIPFKLLNQYGGVPGIFTFDHRYILEPVEKNTRVIIHEDFRGIAVLFWDAGWLEQAYADSNKSLRQQVLELIHDENWGE